MNIDPLAEQYYNTSSYVYAINAPTFFIDPDGREVDVTDLVNGGSKTDTWLLLQLMMNLAEISGEKISTNTRKDGTTVLMSSGCKQGCDPSRSAIGYVSHLLSSDSGVIEVRNNQRNNSKDQNGVPLKNYGSQASPEGIIYLDANQINNFEQSINDAGLNGDSMNTGFVFLHESLHTVGGASYFNNIEDQKEKEGGRFRDPKGVFAKSSSAGNTVKRINKFRREMGLPTRMTYSNWNAKSPGSIVLSVKGKRKEVQIKNKPLKSKK